MSQFISQLPPWLRGISCIALSILALTVLVHFDQREETQEIAAFTAVAVILINIIMVIVSYLN